MDVQAAALSLLIERLQGGGVVLYPTETLYALGCTAEQAQACARIAALKGRPEAKPFPLIVADMDGLRAIAADVPPDLLLLAENFWPGPLSVLVRTRPELAPQVRDAEGYSSVRLTPHPLARELCLRTGAALVATSANKSGQPATAEPRALDPALLSGADAAWLEPPWPAGGAPSTLVRLQGAGRLAVLRAGALPVEALARVFRLEPLPGPGRV